MENDAAREALVAADRAAAAPWIDFAHAPWWMTPFMALYAAALTLNIGLLDGAGGTLTLLALIACSVAVVRVRTRRSGTWPSGQAPRSLGRLSWILFAAGGALGLAVWGIATITSIWVAATVAALGAGALSAWYDAAYARAADELREALA